MGLEHGTGLFDWNMGLDYLTGTWDVCPLMETQHPTGLDWNIIHRNMPAMHKFSTTKNDKTRLPVTIEWIMTANRLRCANHARSINH